MKSSHKQKNLNRPLAILLWVFVWAVFSRIAELSFLLPGPAATLKQMLRLWRTDVFWISLFLSLVRVLLGFLSAVTAGTIIAALCSRFPAIDSLFSPIKSVVRSTPISSFIILVLLWFSSDMTPVFIAFLAVMPIVWQDVQQGIEEVPSDLIEMGHAYHFSSAKMIRHIYVPAVSPFFYTACASGVGFAWKAAIAAEVIARPLYSVGKNLQDAKVYLQTDELFAWTLTVVMLSMMLEFGIKRLISHNGVGKQRKSHDRMS